ncbi:MAG TPA: FimV/HubP family polar landmark protein [Burkholderiales bacterium]|nr:FimV/HubP family polar landmark protein [Burkholderiales bacterium]
MGKRSFSTIVFAAVIFFIPCVLYAAGLGKLTVYSGLGQPLRAEIELLSVAKDEVGTLSARLASPEAFAQAGIAFSSELAAIKLAVDNNSRGQSVIKLSSAQPFNEPFLDLLVELTWSSGRLVREYTALLDPPDVGIPLSPPVAVVPEAIPETKPAVTAPPASQAEEPKDWHRVDHASEASDGGYGPVKSGDTLSKIARDVKPADVNLEQALVSLYRANQEAFRGNMNRLKTGYILRVPDPVEFAAVTKSEAIAEVQAQTGDWNAYRQKLGTAPIAVAERSAKRSASGKITVADARSDIGQSSDVLKISKAETSAAPTAQPSGALQERIKSLEEEVVAKEQAVKEANERVTLLERQVADMQRLVEIKGQAPAAAESKPEAAPAQTEAKPPQAEKPVAAQVAAPPPSESSFFDDLLQNLLYLAAVALVILAGLFGIKALRRKQSSEPAVIVDERTLAADAGEMTYAAAPPQTDDVTETVITAGGAEDMDPLAEAEVYLAYDREAQAEEILQEGLKKTPGRHELHLKLLEMYSRRRDFSSFDAVARQLYNSSGGMGPTWERAAAMGYALNPNNPLYTHEQPVDLTPVAETADEFAAEPEPTATVPEFEFDLHRHQEPQPPASVKSEFNPVETLILHAKREEQPAVEEPELSPEKMIATIDFNLERKSATETDVNFENPVTPSAEKSVFDFTPPKEEPAVQFDELEVRSGNGQSGDFSFAHQQQPALSDIDLNLEDQPAPTSTQDEIWQQVETKFDLARAYHEMGEKEGAREILEEVIKDGDAKQQRAARSMLANL